MTYHQGVFVLERIRLYVPYNLVREKLRELCGFDDVSLHVAQRIISKRLNDLRNVEERSVDGMAFESAYGVLDNERIIAVRWKKIRDRSDWIHTLPVEEILQALAGRNYNHEAYFELECNVWREGRSHEHL
jgi:hypothetical protein